MMYKEAAKCILIENSAFCNLFYYFFFAYATN